MKTRECNKLHELLSRELWKFFLLANTIAIAISNARANSAKRIMAKKKGVGERLEFLKAFRGYLVSGKMLDILFSSFF